MPLPQGWWPGTWQPQEHATGLNQGPLPGDRQSHRLRAAPFLPRRPWAGPGLPARALPGNGQADSCGPLPRTWRPAQGKHRLGLGGGSGQSGLCPPPLPEGQGFQMCLVWPLPWCWGCFGCDWGMGTLRRGGGGDKGQQTQGRGPKPLASPVKGAHSCRDPPPVTEQILHLGLGGCLTRLALLLHDRLPARIPPQR